MLLVLCGPPRPFVAAADAVSRINEHRAAANDMIEPQRPMIRQRIIVCMLLCRRGWMRQGGSISMQMTAVTFC